MISLVLCHHYDRTRTEGVNRWFTETNADNNLILKTLPLVAGLSPSH